MNEYLEMERPGADIDEEIPYSIIENYIFDIKGLSANKKLFILMLRRYAGARQQPARPSYATMMKEMGCGSRTTISKCADFFEWLHWIEKINRSENGKKTTNFYVIHLKNIRMVLKHFADNKYNFEDVEKHFEEEYKKAENKNDFLLRPCKFLL